VVHHDAFGQSHHYQGFVVGSLVEVVVGVGMYGCTG
jgi:hypothetical protein